MLVKVDTLGAFQYNHAAWWTAHNVISYQIDLYVHYFDKLSLPWSKRIVQLQLIKTEEGCFSTIFRVKIDPILVKRSSDSVDNYIYTCHYTCH